MKLKQVLLISLVLVSSLFLSGCTCWFTDAPKPPKPEIITITKIQYVTKPMGPVTEPPIALDYSSSFIRLNNKTYYLTSTEDGEIMMLNYKRYKSWSMTNYNLLKELKDYNATKEYKDK